MIFWWLNSFNLLFIIFGPFQVRQWTYSIHWLFILPCIKTRSVHILFLKFIVFNCVSLIDIYFYFDIWRRVFRKEKTIKVESLVFNLFCDVFFYWYLPATSIWRGVFRNENAVMKWRHYIFFLDVESILLNCVFLWRFLL